MILLLLGLAGYQLVINDALSPPSREELVAAERMYQQAQRDWVASHEQFEQQCRDTGGSQEECVIPEPTLAEFSGQPQPFQEVARTRGGLLVDSPCPGRHRFVADLRRRDVS